MLHVVLVCFCQVFDCFKFCFASAKFECLSLQSYLMKSVPWKLCFIFLYTYTYICDPPYDFRDKGDSTLTTRFHLKTIKTVYNTLAENATIMDKSLGTNLHLWRFFTRAKRRARREFIYVCSAPPPPPIQCWTRVRAISLEVQHCIGGRGESNAF